MDRREVLASIGRFMEGDVVVAVEPDHPFLFSGPDLLLAVPGQLVAAYLPKVREVGQPDILLARQLAARLALPSNVRTVLLVEPGPDGEKIITQVYRDFDEIIEAVDYKMLKAFVLKKRWRQRPERANAIRDAKRKALLRFEILYNHSYRQYSAEKKGISGREVLSGFEYESITLPSWTFRGHSAHTSLVYNMADAYVSAMSSRGRLSSLEKIRPLCVAALRLDYDLDFGVPYLRTSKPNVVFSDAVPLALFDPLKPMRAAAFAGWAISVAESGEDARNSLSELNKDLRVNLE